MTDERFDGETKHGIPTGSIEASDLQEGDIFPMYGTWYKVIGEIESKTRSVKDRSFERTSGEHHKDRYRDMTMLYIPVDVIDVDEGCTTGNPDKVALGPQKTVQIYEKPTP